MKRPGVFKKHKGLINYAVSGAIQKDTRFKMVIREAQDAKKPSRIQTLIEMIGIADETQN